MLDAEKGLKNRWQHGEQNPKGLGWEAGGGICALLRLAPSGPSPHSPSLLASSKSESLWVVRTGVSCPVAVVLFPLLLSLFGGACWFEASRKSLLVWRGWRLVFCLALFPSPRRPPSFGKSACKQVEAWSLNVSDSKPEVGSASAGQTSFAGVEKRGAGGGKGGQTAVGHLKPSAAGNAEEREGEGAGGREWGEQGSQEKGARCLCLELGGCGSFPRHPGRRSLQPPPAPPAWANCCESVLVLAALVTGASSILTLSEFCCLPVWTNPLWGAPFSLVFQYRIFYLFFPFGSEVLESHLEPGVWLTFFSPLARRSRGGLREKTEDAEDKPSKAVDYKLVGASKEKEDIISFLSSSSASFQGGLCFNESLISRFLCWSKKFTLWPSLTFKLREIYHHP